VIEIAHNVAFNFIQFYFIKPTVKKNFGFWILDCGFVVSLRSIAFIKMTEFLKSKIRNLKSKIFGK